MTELPDHLRNELLRAAGITTREAAANLINAAQCLEAAGIQARWVTETAYLLADLAHELEPSGLRLHDNNPWPNENPNPDTPSSASNG